MADSYLLEQEVIPCDGNSPFLLIIPMLSIATSGVRATFLHVRGRRLKLDMKLRTPDDDGTP